MNLEKHQPANLPPVRQPRRERPEPRYQSRSDMRLAFEIKRGGGLVKRVPATSPFNLSTEYLWWSDTGDEARVTVVDGGKLYLEITDNLLNGTTDAAHKLASVFGVSTACGAFQTMYWTLVGMLAPRLAD